MGNFSRGLFLLSAAFIITGCLSASPQLLILPSQPVQAKPIGKPVLLTCRALVQEKNLISDLQWLDPYNRTINNDNPTTRGRMSTEVIPERALALMISAIQEIDAGQYTCMATYANTQKLYSSVRIETIVAITWLDAPEEQFPIVGQNSKVRCKVSANPSPTVNWRRNGEPLTNDDGGHFVREPDGLLIQGARTSDDGIYTCRAYVVVTGEMAERNIRVEVHTAPRFDEAMPSELEVIDSETASITCKATGKPQPVYSWIKASTQQNLALGSDRFTVNQHTGVLTITRVTREDNGEFKCVAKNAAGTEERSVNFVVVIKPNVVDVKNVSVPEGKEARLECRATGNPSPVIRFWKLGTANELVAGIQPSDDRIVVEQRLDMERGQVVGTLVISDLQTRDDGLYACIARNKGGESRKNGHLTVEFKPTFVNSPMKEAWTWAQRPANLTCLAESIPNATISWRLNNRDIEREPHFKKYGNGPQSSLLVTPTAPGFYGVYKCVAKNMHGEAELSIKLQEAHIPSELLQAKIEVITATTITFSFVGPSNPGGRPVKAILVQYKEERKNWNDSRNKTWSFDSPYILEGLEPQRTYNFRFAAANDVGRGNWAATQHHTMPKRSFPEEPRILNVPLPEGYLMSPYADHFELRWHIPADNGEPIDRYQIEYCTVHKVNDQWAETETGCRLLDLKSTEMTVVELNELTPDTYYKVELRAHNVIGFSLPGQVVVKTARGEDSANWSSDESYLSSAIIVAIVVAALFIILIIVDISCYFVNDTGLLWLMCGKRRSRKPSEDDARLGSEGKELLNNGNREGKVRIASSPMLDDNSLKKDTAVEFDGRKSIAKTAFVGKDSAV